MEEMRTTVELNLDEYMRFAFTVQRQNKKYRRAKWILMIGLFVLAVINFATKNKSLGILMILMVVAFPTVLDIMMKKQIRQAYEQNKSIQGLKNELLFFDDHYEVHSEVGDNRYEYNKLWRIIETPTNFYIMMSETSGSVVIKSNCSDKLINHIYEIKEKLE